MCNFRLPLTPPAQAKKMETRIYIGTSSTADRNPRPPPSLMARVPFRSLPSHRAECSTTQIDGHFTWDDSLMDRRIGPHERRPAQNVCDRSSRAAPRQAQSAPKGSPHLAEPRRVTNKVPSLRCGMTIPSKIPYLHPSHRHNPCIATIPAVQYPSQAQTL